jgi:hypothetical protein
MVATKVIVSNQVLLRVFPAVMKSFDCAESGAQQIKVNKY